MRQTPLDLPQEIEKALTRLQDLSEDHELLRFRPIIRDAEDEISPDLEEEFFERFDKDGNQSESDIGGEYLCEIEDAIEEAQAAVPANEVFENV